MCFFGGGGSGHEKDDGRHGGVFLFLSQRDFTLPLLGSLFIAAHNAVGYVKPVYYNMPLVPAKQVPLSS